MRRQCCGITACRDRYAGCTARGHDSQGVCRRDVHRVRPWLWSPCPVCTLHALIDARQPANPQRRSHRRRSDGRRVQAAVSEERVRLQSDGFSGWWSERRVQQSVRLLVPRPVFGTALRPCRTQSVRIDHLEGFAVPLEDHRRQLRFFALRLDRRALLGLKAALAAEREFDPHAARDV